MNGRFGLLEHLSPCADMMLVDIFYVIHNLQRVGLCIGLQLHRKRYGPWTSCSLPKKRTPKWSQNKQRWSGQCWVEYSESHPPVAAAMSTNRIYPEKDHNTKLKRGATGFSLGGITPSTTLTLFLSLWKRSCCPATWFADLRLSRAIQLADAHAALATSNTWIVFMAFLPGDHLYIALKASRPHMGEDLHVFHWFFHITVYGGNSYCWGNYG